MSSISLVNSNSKTVVTGNEELTSNSLPNELLKEVMLKLGVNGARKLACVSKGFAALRQELSFHDQQVIYLRDIISKAIQLPHFPMSLAQEVGTLTDNFSSRTIPNDEDVESGRDKVLEHLESNFKSHCEKLDLEPTEGKEVDKAYIELMQTNTINNEPGSLAKLLAQLG